MKDIKFLIEKPIAHRGLWSENVAENSLIAFSRALDAGHPIELDVQMTADGKLVVFHDWTLERMTESDGNVAKQKYNDIKNLTLEKSNQKILLFEDVLNLVNGEVGLIIEIKSQLYFNYEICNKVYDLLKKYDGKYAISSFDPFIVKWFKKNAPEVVRGQNFTDFSDSVFVIGFCKKIFAYIFWIFSNNKSDFFVFEASMLPKSFFVRFVIKIKKPILVYAIMNNEEYNKIKSVINNQIFDINFYE